MYIACWENIKFHRELYEYFNITVKLQIIFWLKKEMGSEQEGSRIKFSFIYRKLTYKTNLNNFYTIHNHKIAIYVGNFTVFPKNRL